LPKSIFRPGQDTRVEQSSITFPGVKLKLMRWANAADTCYSNAWLAKRPGKPNRLWTFC